MKRVARKQVSHRKTSTATTTVFKKRRGGVASKKGKKPQVESYVRHGYSGNKCMAMLGETAYREERIFNDEVGPHQRRAEQLCALGKQRLPSKVKKEERGVWASIVPAGTEMSVLGLLAAMVVGDITPLYSLGGKHRAPGPNAQ